MIVAQNKKGIVNFDNVVLIKIKYYEKDMFILEGWVKENWVKLGKYPTEQRAKEVLQEITDYYNRGEDFRTAFYMPKE